MNALAPALTAAWTGRGRRKERLPCQRVLWNRLHHTQPFRATFANGGVAKEQCAFLQSGRLRDHLEQLGRVGGDGRFSRN